jgi:outer membrane protein assembly factor BamD
VLGVRFLNRFRGFEMRGHVVKRATPALLTLAVALACASSPDEIDFADVPEADELYRQGMDHLENGRKILFLDVTDYGAAIESFQDVIDNYPYSEYAVLSELKIADAYFQQGHYEEALSYYRDFADLHPDHEQVAYTIYRSAMSYYEQSHGAGRDQTATQQALTQLDRLLTEHPQSPYTAEAEDLWRQLRTRLARHALEIGDFYMDRDEFQSAADRFRSVLNQYPGLGLDAEALYKLGLCYSKMNLDDEANRIFQVILENYEGTDVARAAEDLVPAAQ